MNDRSQAGERWPAAATFTRRPEPILHGRRPVEKRPTASLGSVVVRSALGGATDDF